MKTPAGSSSEIRNAVAALRRGECIGLPTETVYGLAADARNAAAVRKIFALKQRPVDHPLIVHLPAVDQLADYACDVSNAAWKLAERHWPGPLTLVLARHPSVPLEVTGGQDTIALRIPAHPLAQEVLREFGGGLAAPSANRFGRISPTTAEHVRQEFGAALPIVLDGGPCAVGIESTIVDCTGTFPRILRPGMLTADALGILAQSADSSALEPRVPGALAQHYAPRTRMFLLPRAALGDQAAGAKILAIGDLPAGLSGISLPADPVRYARGLYAALRELDAMQASELRVEIPPESQAWAAILDRLGRAAAGAGKR